MKSFFLKLLFSSVFAVGALLSFQAQASFEGRYLSADTSNGFDAYYDTDMNLTWLADASYQGTKSWQAADDWVQTLRLGDYENWRLPTVAEFSEMWVTELGNYQFGLGNPNPFTYNPGPFKNVQYFVTGFYNSSVLKTAAYWTSETSGDNAYAWLTYGGGVVTQVKESVNYSTWVVRSGDAGFAGAPVPLPATWLLFLGGLGCLRLRSKAI
jgi:hypothetical protein